MYDAEVIAYFRNKLKKYENTAWLKYYSLIFKYFSIISCYLTITTIIVTYIFQIKPPQEIILLLIFIFVFGIYSEIIVKTLYSLDKKAFRYYILHVFVTADFYVNVVYIISFNKLLTLIISVITILIWVIPNIVYIIKIKKIFYDEPEEENDNEKKEEESISFIDENIDESIDENTDESETIENTDDFTLEEDLSPIIFSRELAKPEKKKDKKYD
jgi:hypothetical protein